MTCPLPKQDFTIRLIAAADGVRICFSQDGVQFCDELAQDWAHAFRECIHMFANGLKGNRESDVLATRAWSLALALPSGKPSLPAKPE